LGDSHIVAYDIIISMVDVGKQVAFWREGAIEDWAVAGELIAIGHSRHGLFFAHLALEKLLKACIVKQTGDLAPRSHNVVRLAEIAQLSLSETVTDLLAEMNIFNIEGRYPDSLAAPLSQDEAQSMMERAGEVFEWLTNQL
jgi:HEPN domain-containing protein